MIRAGSSMPAPSASAVGFWDQQLGYAHAFLTVVTALTVGMGFHVWVGYTVLEVIPSAVIGSIALAPLLSLAILARSHPGQRLVKWLTGIPFAMVSSGAVGLLALVGGIVPASTLAQRFGVESLWASWPFLFASFLMMLNLVGSCGRRALPLTYTNVVYLMSHLGLAIALIGGGYSAMTMERRTMVLFKEDSTQVAYDRNDREYKAPFAARLKEFRMDTFAPTLTVARMDAASPDGLKQTSSSFLLKKGVTEKVAGHTLTVEEFYAHAAYDGLHWREIPWKTAAPAAKIKVTRPDGSQTSGWVSCGSPDTIPAYLQLSEDSAVLMNQPRPKKFESDVTLDGKTFTVGVNQPAKVNGWDVYQFSYDEKMGAASQYSVIELVRDNGLPVVYSGIFMMLIGACLHLWNGVGGRK